MLMLQKFLTIMLFLLTFKALAQPCRQVVGYYPSWKWYNRNFLVNPNSIDFSKYSIINYAFFQPNRDGSISSFDPNADKVLLLGTLKKGTPPGYLKNTDFGNREFHETETSLIAKAQEKDSKVLISIGGWTLSDNFSAISEDSIKRARFAGSCNELVRVYGVDGVDIDWEYPCYSANKGKPSDRENFTLLLKEIRDSFDLLQPSVSKSLFITAAFGVAPVRMACIEWDKVVPLLNYINLMTYDFYGSNYSRATHHAPLYPPEFGLKGFSMHSVVDHLTDVYKVPHEKINIGLAFYGRSQKTNGNPDLHTSTLRMPDSETFPDERGTPMFYSIIASQSLFNYFWDNMAQAPFLKGKNDLNTFVSFDDEYSIALKARYVKYHGLAGTMVWDITGDFIEANPGSGVVVKTPLIDILNKILCYNEAITNTYFPKTEAINFLPHRFPMVKQKSYTPRLLWEPAADKKLTKAQKRKARNNERFRKKSNNKEPDRYFNGGW
jgi:GH18 family chitinase